MSPLPRSRCGDALGLLLRSRCLGRCMRPGRSSIDTVTTGPRRLMNRCLPLKPASTLTPVCLIAGALLVGCQSGPIAPLFAKKDRTSFVTPDQRIAKAEAVADSARGAAAEQQQTLLNDLAREIQTETDPLVREALVASIAQFPQPLADQVLTAGLADPDAGVRQQCCRALGKRGQASSAAELARVAKSDESFDVRIAATKALGELRAPEAVQALVASLEDSDPAMQFAGVQAMRAATGKDFGGNVEAYLAYARGDEAAATSIATRPRPGNQSSFLQRLSPF